MRFWTMTILALAAIGVGDAAAGPQDIPSFRDCADCPPMVIVPAGAFTMGSPDNEPDRDSDEGPQRRIVIPHPFAVGRTEVTRAQYGAFARATGKPEGGGCHTDRVRRGTWAEDSLGTWRDPGFPQDEDHPVVCVSWEEASAYVAWLNARTGGGYRLLSEAEWEYATRAGSTGAYAWDDPDGACVRANVPDAAAKAAYPDWTTAACDDGAIHTAQAGAYRANAFGLHDMIGNVWEWVEDCYAPTLPAAPVDGRAFETEACRARVDRGGGWGYVIHSVRSASRNGVPPSVRHSRLGFRVARTLTGAGARGSVP